MNRSDIMRRIRSKGNRTTEVRFRSALARAGVAGFKVQPRMPERPDFAFPDERVAVYVDGCFWHGCRDHFKAPASNRIYWIRKIHANQRRDAQSVAALLAKGWKVFRLWEHDLADGALLGDLVLRVARAVDTPDGSEWAARLGTYELQEATGRFWCPECLAFRDHHKRDLSGKGVYLETFCVECGHRCARINRRIVWEARK